MNEGRVVGANAHADPTSSSMPQEATKASVVPLNWILTFGLACFGAIGMVLVLAWTFGGIDMKGVSTHGIIAIVLGIMFTVLVAVGLMALIFYSNRAGMDDQ